MMHTKTEGNRVVMTTCWHVWMTFLFLGLTAVTAQTAPTITDRYTPVVQSVPSPPRWFHGTDNQVHLAYELVLTNAFPVPVTVTSIEVLGVDSTRPLATVRGNALSNAMSLLATGGEPATTLSASAMGVVWFDLPFANRAELPTIVRHRLTVQVPPGLPVPKTITHVGGRAEVDARAPIVLGPPLLGAGWAALGSCCDGPHRRAFQPLNGELYLSQRFAIDFNRLNTASRIVVGDPDENASYPTYDQPVLAVADSIVVTTEDRWPDQTPNHPRPVTLEEADGNYIILELGDSSYAFYAHLKPGSVLVRPGQRVTQGERLARTGNSGSSSGPHLHFHVMDAPSALAADGLPYAFDTFSLTGRTPPLETLLESDPLAPVPIDTEDTGIRKDVLPLGRDVVTFTASSPAGRD
jgi:hypothetical protein